LGNTKADFDDFSDYEADFDSVVQFVLEYVHQRNNKKALGSVKTSKDFFIYLLCFFVRYDICFCLG
jgi:hypothetical protein